MKIKKVYSIIIATLLFGLVLTAVPTMAGDLNSVYGYLSINGVVTSESGIEVKIIFTDPPEEFTDLTDSNGYFQIDFAGHNFDTGTFTVKYLGDWYTPEGNPVVDIIPSELGYEIDLNIIYSPPPPPPSGPIASWHFDEGTGNIAYDSSGNGNDGIIYGAAWTTNTPCIGGYALDFDGNVEYVDVSSVINDLNDEQTGTIVAWIYKTSQAEPLDAPTIFDAAHNTDDDTKIHLSILEEGGNDYLTIMLRDAHRNIAFF